MVATLILDSPEELIVHILVRAEPVAVITFAETCREARAFVYGQHNEHFWRRLFLNSFDDPRYLSSSNTLCASESAPHTIDWKHVLHKRVYAMRMIQEMTSLKTTLSTLISVARNATPMSYRLDELNDLAWIKYLADGHSAPGLDPSIDRELTVEEEQHIAKLWSFVGWRDSLLTKGSKGLLQVRNHARAFVYDFRNYICENHWGPFMADRSGRVNWKHMKAIIVVMYSNLVDLGELWLDTRPSARLDAIRTYSAPITRTGDRRDWAGVEGTWRRYVCFMDHRDLFTFNYTAVAHNPSFFEGDGFREATRLTELNLRITSFDDEKKDDYTNFPSSSSTTSAANYFPVIHFVGESRGENVEESRVRGSVRMTPDGHIRWRLIFASIHDSYSHWSSEGIQIGDVCSAAGVVGTWTGAHHEGGDPVGPFWMWKVNDDHPSRPTRDD
ncbi:uncharacterized protein FOMMEDRAFT_106791 [Fomitiporia mediterranea MF3/22]|uniref:uncharacterized protein n=1 Tax=Fomitiporia mediterranea (strain MF3/22) TaxID=694068 RepID=UPI0004407E43|nr:uncharacterized protein FOMMEDRAFT_106791 [Fomitiporia mediterranea MF3/22]EJD04234.1 hypothetical protein FOMMEDRAFT_106791 [Fomitiporia mediterranea MF3/22]